MGSDAGTHTDRNPAAQARKAARALEASFRDQPHTRSPQDKRLREKLDERRRNRADADADGALVDQALEALDDDPELAESFAFPPSAEGAAHQRRRQAERRRDEASDPDLVRFYFETEMRAAPAYRRQRGRARLRAQLIGRENPAALTRNPEDLTPAVDPLAAPRALHAAKAGSRRQRTTPDAAATPLKNDAQPVIKDGSKRNEPVTQIEHSPPTTEDELTAIQERGLVLSQTAQTVAGLGLEGVDVQVQVAGLHEIATRCEQLARNIGMQAINEGRMTQRQLSRLVNVHELTVGRWMKAANEEQQDQ